MGQTTSACTRGIWVQDTGVELNGGRVVLMDSEGLASVDQDEQHDAKIFCLALLLSSMFVLNSQGVIDESAIDRLYLIGEITKRVCVSAGAGAGTAAAAAAAAVTAADAAPAASAAAGDDGQPSRLSDFFPPFVWLLRDFHLELEHNGRQMTRGEYLEQSLADRPTSGGGRRAAERNDTRRAIRSLFRRRQCFTLVRPALQEEDLRRAGELGDDVLRPEFLSEMTMLTALISSQMPRKSVLGTDLDGAQLVNLASRYLTAINGGAVPEITGAWQSVVADTYREALAAATERHKASTSRGGGSTNSSSNSSSGGNRGGDYLERTATAFDEDFRSRERAAREDALRLFETMTRGCSMTVAGERQRLAAEQELRLAMFECEGKRRKDHGERCAAAAERLLERDLPSTLFQGKEEHTRGEDGKGNRENGMDVDQCFTALDDGLEAFRKASAAEKDMSYFLPEAPRNMCMALQRRVLPALRSAVRSRKTRWQIAESDLSRRLGTSEVSVCAGGGSNTNPDLYFRLCEGPGARSAC